MVYQVTNQPNIVLTDLEEAIAFIKINQKLNSIPDTAVLIQVLKWGSREDIDIVLNNKGFDYIFVSNVLYNTYDFACLISILCQLTFNNKHTIIIFGYKPRGLKSSE